MKKTAHVAVLILIFTASISGFQDMNPKAEIKKLLSTQVEAWNRADFVGFMSAYWNSPEMTFQSGSQRLYGWETLLKRYQTTYAGDKAGRLTFDDLKITILDAELALVLGRFHLEYPDTHKLGIFTIILRKFSQGWQIIHDHSSS